MISVQFGICKILTCNYFMKKVTADTNYYIKATKYFHTTDLATVHEQDHGLELVLLVGRNSKYFVEVSVHIMLLSARE